MKKLLQILFGIKKPNPTEEFKKYCEEFPWALECRIYED